MARYACWFGLLHILITVAVQSIALQTLYILRQIRPSVCPSVCSSHSDIVSKQGNAGDAVFTVG